MEGKDLKAILDAAIKNQDDDAARNQYCDAITECLKAKKIPDEVLGAVIRGVDIDRAANFFDYLEKVQKGDIQSLWRRIRDSKEIKDNSNNNAVKFLSALLLQSLTRLGNTEAICSGVLTALMHVLKNENKQIPGKIYEPIILDYLIMDIPPKGALLRWEEIKAPGEVSRDFAEIILAITADEEKQEEYKVARNWASSGIRYAEKKLRTEKIEARIPKSHINELMALVQHYQSVEEQVRKAEYRIEDLGDEIQKLQGQIVELNQCKHSLEEEVKRLESTIEAKQGMLSKAEREVDERKAINDAFNTKKKMDEAALLSDIANELKAIHQDFMASASDPMDEVLGEIYREHIRNIFKILKNKGIEVE